MATKAKEVTPSAEPVVEEEEILVEETMVKVIMVHGGAGYNEKGQLITWADGEEVELPQSEAKRMVATGQAKKRTDTQIKDAPVLRRATVKVKAPKEG